MKYYVIHYTKNTHRRARLEAQLDTEAEWVEAYDREDPIIEKIKIVTRSPLSLKDISCSLKHFLAMKKMVDDNISEAVILEDDVVFLPEFKEVRPFHASGLLRLGLGVGVAEPHRPPPSSTRVYITDNPGGSEATWITKQFAEEMIKNISFDNTIDMIQYAVLMNSFNERMRCMNTCFQTSLDARTPGRPATEWKIFCKNFKNFKRFNFEELMIAVGATDVHHAHRHEAKQ